MPESILDLHSFQTFKQGEIATNGIGADWPSDCPPANRDGT